MAMPRLLATLPGRLVLLLATLLLGWGVLVGLLAWRVAAEQEHEALQRLSHGLAQHITEHWPELGGGNADDEQARKELLRMLMTVNPGIQVYVLDPLGRVQNYIGEPGMVRQQQVDLGSLRAFLDGAALPLYGTDPMGSGRARLFSAAMFPRSVAGSAGYLYVVLDGPARYDVLARLSAERIWRTAQWIALSGLAVALLLGVMSVRLLTRPLQRLAQRMAGFQLPDLAGAARQDPSAHGPSSGAEADEVAVLSHSFEQMSQRLAAQQAQQQVQAVAHREVIAHVAHDLRTPLTALHGHLEALQAGVASPERVARHLDTALAQSDKLRRLTQQLFELATLQSLDQAPQRERFRLDELVADAVQKFELLAGPPRVGLAGAEPGAVEVLGDLHLIERALTNLIDNALRHTTGEDRVRVSVRRCDQEVAVLVQDNGPGLPEELRRRLDSGVSVRDPAVRRPAGGGMGGLGLAIAQRIAVLHGGRLHTLPAPQGGTTLRLALPLPSWPPQRSMERQ
jgi:signal transduction histidine kinase